MFESTIVDDVKVKESKVTYPRLMQHVVISDKSKEFVVLFTKPKTGMVVQSNNYIKSWEVGEHCDDWLEDTFVPFYGNILLKQTEYEND